MTAPQYEVVNTVTGDVVYTPDARGVDGLRLCLAWIAACLDRSPYRVRFQREGVDA